MSHFTTLVIGENPEALLAPYDENTDVEPYRRYEGGDRPSDHWLHSILVKEDGLDANTDWPTFIEVANRRYPEEPIQYDVEADRAYTISTYNPKSKWDWYSLGGRWTGYYKLRDPGRAKGIVGGPGVFGDVAKPGWVDQARKGDIDFDGMRAQAEAEAVSAHAQALAALGDNPKPARWEHVHEQMFPDDIDAARRFYHNQSGIQALRAAEIYADEPVDWYCLDEDDPKATFIARQVAQADVPFAILTADGWAEKGHMGWWAVVTNEDAAWHVTARQIIDAAPESALFSLYDLHI